MAQFGAVFFWCLLLINLFSATTPALSHEPNPSGAAASSPATQVISFDGVPPAGWVSVLTRIAALLEEDADACHQQCNIVIRAAQEQGEDAVGATALMQRACAKASLVGIEESDEDFRMALQLFPIAASDSLQLLFTQALFFRQHFLGAEHTAYVPTPLHPDLDGRLSFENHELYLRLICDVMTFNKQEPREADAYCRLGQFRTMLVGANQEELRARFDLIELQNQLIADDPVSANSLLPQAQLLSSRVASSQLSRSLRIQTLLMMTRLHYASKDYELATGFLRSASAEAALLRNQSLMALCETVGMEQHDTDEGQFEQVQIRMRTVAPLIPSINCPRLLRRILAIVSMLPMDGDGKNTRSALKNVLNGRLKTVEGYAAMSMQALGRWNTMRVSRMLSFQSDRISAEQLRADKEGHRSLMFARVGFAIFCGLAMILLRERWQLRKANQRLEKEIENADQQRQAKERMEIRLAQTERLESLGALAGGVAHDFNNLLVGVIGNADLLRHIENVTPQGMKCLDGIIRSAETAAGLSRKMLAYAGKQPATKRTVDLNESISRMLPLLKAGLGNRHRISFFASPGPLLTEGDSEQLDQILLNLVSNSAQAMVMEKGAITIQTGSAIYDSIPVDVPTFGNRKTGGHFVWFEVADNGHGIGESDLARVFEPFFSTREKSPGHGFGLAVVYGHVNRHDGLIQVMSSRGNGSRFRVLLPQSTKTHHSSVERVSPGNPSALSPGLRVVAIDDQSAVLEVLERVIATVGGETVIFTSATDAMEYLSETLDVDCVLLDLQMPILDGPSVLDEMSIKGIRVPVVLMSGFSPENPDDLSRHPRVKAILQKPFRPEDVISAISMAIVDHGANSVNSSVCLTADRTTRASV